MAYIIYHRFKSSLAFFLLMTLSFQGGIRAQGAYVLEWSDEFDVDGAPNPENWGYEQGYVRNNEDQYYTRNRRENARVEDGHLVIQAHRDNWEGHEYTSASIITNGRHEWTYGRFELRAKIDIRQGSWPAWWTVGSERSWPAGGEIDMMEFYRGTLLFNTYCGNNCNGGWDTETRRVDEEWASEFHIWKMIWTEDSINLYLDDELMNTTDLSQTFVNGNNPFREPHWMFINQAIGGNNGGDPSGTEFPITYMVDYVRVYQWDPDATPVEQPSEGGGSIRVSSSPGTWHIKLPEQRTQSSQFNISLFDVSGNRLAKLKGSREYNWSHAHLPPGIYFLKADLAPPIKLYKP